MRNSIITFSFLCVIFLTACNKSSRTNITMTADALHVIIDQYIALDASAHEMYVLLKGNTDPQYIMYRSYIIDMRESISSIQDIIVSHEAVSPCLSGASDYCAIPPGLFNAMRDMYLVNVRTMLMFREEKKNIRILERKKIV